jgi:Ser-tRNA(Ala) deacylase AlaX
VIAGEDVGAESEVGGEEDCGLLVNGGEDELLDDSTENGLEVVGISDEDGVAVTVGAVVAGELSGAVLVDGG